MSELITPLLHWLDNGLIGTAIRRSSILFPLIECLHVLAITSMVGTIAIVDLRLMGLASKKRPVMALMDEILPLTRIAFGLAVVTGALLFTSHATDYVQKWPFVLKMGLLVVALVNIVVFHRFTLHDSRSWNDARLPLTARLGGGFSLALWIAIVAAGRWIGFIDL